MTTRDDSKGFYEFTKLMSERRERKMAEKKVTNDSVGKQSGLTFQKHLSARIS